MVDLEKILTDTRKTLEPPQAWAKGVLSETNAQQCCSPRDCDAVCWCLLGGIYKNCDRIDEEVVYDFVAEFLPREYLNSIPSFNDDSKTTHEDVLAILDKAIAKAQILKKEHACTA